MTTKTILNLKIWIMVIILACPKAIRAQSIIYVAGNGTSGYTGDGGAATAAEIQSSDIVIDYSGNIIFANGDVIRRVTLFGTITTIAGNGTGGYSGDGGQATNAQLNAPSSLAIDYAGNIYFEDYLDNVVRKISTSGIVTTVAGNGSGGYSGDGGPATNASFGLLEGIAVDPSGRIYIADQQTIRMVDLSGQINIFAGQSPGTGGTAPSGDGGQATAANLITPTCVATNETGDVFIGSPGSIRKVNSSGIISTVAGIYPGYGLDGDGGPATNARLSFVLSIKPDRCGNIFFNQRALFDTINYIRKINAAGTICTFGHTGYNLSIALDSLKNIYLSTYNLIGKMSYDLSPITNDTVMCAGASIVLSNECCGGTWSSSNTSVVSIDASSGTAFGISAGNATISYSITDACSTTTVTKNITVNPNPDAGSITGLDSLCQYTNTLLIDGVVGGVWNSSNTTIATINSSGNVYGLLPGTDTITYTVTALGCSSSTSKVIRVKPAPVAGPIVSTRDSICQGATCTLTGANPGGVWSNRHLTVDTIGSSSGIVKGAKRLSYSVLPDTITYTYTNSCGTNSATHVIWVKGVPGISGTSTACIGSTITYTGAPVGYHCAWTYSNASYVTTSTSGTTSGLLTALAASSGTTAATFTYYFPGDYSACADTISKGIIVGPNPVLTFVANSCGGGASPLNAGCMDTFKTTTSPITWSVTRPSVASICYSSANKCVLCRVSSGTDSLVCSYNYGGCISKAYFSFAAARFVDDSGTIQSENGEVNVIQYNINPNPNNGHMIVSPDRASSTTSIAVRLIDIAGKILIRSNLELVNGSAELDGSGLSSGIYFIELDDHVSGKQIRKVVIQK